MRFHYETALDCSPHRAWKMVRTTALLKHVAFPLLSFKTPKGHRLPVRWRLNESYALRLYLLGCIPLGRHVLRIERLDVDAMTIATRESGALAKTSDELDIRSGWLTIAIVAFARCFYRYRQARWRRLARRLNKRRPAGNGRDRAAGNDSADSGCVAGAKLPQSAS
jgi:hypothetical protein